MSNLSQTIHFNQNNSLGGLMKQYATEREQKLVDKICKLAEKYPNRFNKYAEIIIRRIAKRQRADIEARIAAEAKQ